VPGFPAPSLPRRDSAAGGPSVVSCAEEAAFAGSRALARVLQWLVDAIAVLAPAASSRSTPPLASRKTEIAMGRTTGRSALGLLGSIALMAALGCGVTADTGGGNSDGTITIQNGSTHVLTALHVAPVSQISWGPNLLPDVLFTSEQITVQVSCSTYDVLVIDDRQRDCVLGNLDLCFSDQVWVIDDFTLRNCGY